jgi:hypothetical protein
MEQQHQISYTGPAPFASAVAQTLNEAGLAVSWTRPDERRDAQAMLEAVTVYYICKGTDAAVKAAVDKAREALGKRGRVEVEVAGSVPHEGRYEPRHRK